VKFYIFDRNLKTSAQYKFYSPFISVKPIISILKNVKLELFTAIPLRM